jgi:hypothetical protein
VAMHYGEYCILREETVRERRGSYNEFCCRLYPFICWIIIKEGPGNFSGGRSLHWVNHVNLCLSCIVYLCVLFPHLFYFIASRSCFSNTKETYDSDELQLSDLREFLFNALLFLPE